jgi:hypothetical protein
MRYYLKITTAKGTGKLGTIAQDYNSSNLGGKDQKNCGSSLAQAKKFKTLPQPMAGHGGMLL